jgi:hypothetical protein
MGSKTAAMRERQMKFAQMLRGYVMWLVVATSCCSAVAQQAAKPMTNLDVTKMVAGGVPESVVKTKPNSMSTLAADTTLGSAMQAGVNTTTSIASSHAGGSSGMAIGQAGGILNGAMARRKPKITYIWAVPGVASASVVPFVTVSFDVNFAGAAGVTLDDFEPAIVKLTPAQNAFRLIGATEGSADAGSDPTADWQIYNGFVQDKVASTVKKIAPGHFQISPGSALLPGEYAVVLRPVSKGKKFSGADVARYQGEGIIFDSVWSFQVSADAQAH